MPTYYTYKADVPLKSGQTLAFTPGRGYYAAGSTSGGSVELISEHGAGGGYTPGDTGLTPTPQQIQQGYPDVTPPDQPSYDVGSQQDSGGGSSLAQSLAARPFDFTTDPGYLAALAAEQAGSQQADAALKAAQEQAIVRFGDPSLAQALGIQLDPVTAAMAQQNTQAGNSTLARLQKQRDLNQQGIVNSLAAHGIIRSGDLGYKTGQNEQAYGTGLYDQQQTLLDSLAGFARQTASDKQGLHTNVVNAMTGAYQSYVSNPALWSYPLNDGGQAAAASAAATQQAAAPDAQSFAQPQMPGFTAPYKAPTSRLAAKPLASPYGGQAARNVRYG